MTKSYNEISEYIKRIHKGRKKPYVLVCGITQNGETFQDVHAIYIGGFGNKHKVELKNGSEVCLVTVNNIEKILSEKNPVLTELYYVDPQTKVARLIYECPFNNNVEKFAKKLQKNNMKDYANDVIEHNQDNENEMQTIAKKIAMAKIMQEKLKGQAMKEMKCTITVEGKKKRSNVVYTTCNYKSENISLGTDMNVSRMEKLTLQDGTVINVNAIRNKVNKAFADNKFDNMNAKEIMNFATNFNIEETSKKDMER